MAIDAALETDVLRRLDEGDTSGAAALLIRGYGPELLGYLTAVLRDADRGADAFSILSENVWTSLGAFKRQSSVRTWVYKVAYNAALRLVRDPARRRGRPLATTEAHAIAAEVRTATAPYLRTEVKTAVQRLRDELADDEQTLLILRIDRGLEWSDVAEVLELSEPAVRKRFERVKEKLRKLATERGLLGD